MARRWALVVGLIAVLVAVPVVLGARPAQDRPSSAAELRAAVLDSADVGFAGYAVSAGGLSLPVSEDLPTVADLFSDRTSMRVWWRGPQTYRVDVLTPTGETDVHRDPAGTWTWDYATSTATRADLGRFSFPAPPDLLPSSLGRRLLAEAGDDELSRIGARRIAGVDALGLRLRPADAAASVDRVDLWVDPDTALVLAVQVRGGSDDPDTLALDTRFLDFDPTPPGADVVAFTPPAGATVRPAADVDRLIAAAEERIGEVALPPELAGLPRREQDGAPASIGLYGRGVTLLAVVPISRDLARSLSRSLAGDRATAGPAGLLVVRSRERGAYLLTGTVTLDALAAAAAQL